MSKAIKPLYASLLSQAWRHVLADPHYMERRHFEERKRVEEDEQKRTAGSLGWRKKWKNATAFNVRY